MRRCRFVTFNEGSAQALLYYMIGKVLTSKCYEQKILVN
jgi:hypothetical protein